MIDVPRGGDSSRMPLHGTVLVCLEMIVLSVASTTPKNGEIPETNQRSASGYR